MLAILRLVFCVGASHLRLLDRLSCFVRFVVVGVGDVGGVVGAGGRLSHGLSLPLLDFTSKDVRNVY